jgi:hypothetical protein
MAASADATDHSKDSVYLLVFKTMNWGVNGIQSAMLRNICTKRSIYGGTALPLVFCLPFFWRAAIARRNLRIRANWNCNLRWLDVSLGSDLRCKFNMDCTYGRYSHESRSNWLWSSSSQSFPHAWLPEAILYTLQREKIYVLPHRHVKN